jgi:hypothetical protein
VITLAQSIPVVKKKNGKTYPDSVIYLIPNLIAGMFLRYLFPKKEFISWEGMGTPSKG